MDPFLLRHVTPQLDVIIPGGGTVSPRVAQPAVATRGILLLLYRSLRLLLEDTSLAGADLLYESSPSRVLVTVLLLTCCRKNGQTSNTELLTIRANETWCLTIILWLLDYRFLIGDIYRRNERHYTSQQFIVSATENRFCFEV